MQSYRNFLVTVFVGAIVLGSFSQAHAIPAFSREHNTECATCHTIFPELNEYGDAFLKNGFVWNKPHKGEVAGNLAIKGEGDPEVLEKLKAAASAPVVPTADEPLLGAAKKSELLWLAGLPQTVPISLAAALNASYNDDLRYDEVDLSTRAVSLLAGGVFKDKLAFYLKYNLYSEGRFDPAISNTPVNLDPPYANDLEEFYLVWRNTLNTPINFKLGRFRPQLSLWKKTNKTGISDFATTSFKVGSSTFSADAPEDAIEANTVLFNRLFVATGLVDRNGQDSNEGYGHISLKIGGSDFRANEPDIDFENESIFDYMYLVLGGYGYAGRNSGSTASNQRNNFYRVGADVDMIIKNARVKLAFAREHDSNPDFSSHAKHVIDVWAAQAEYMVTTELLAFVRYEMENLSEGGRVHRYIPAIAYAPIQNTKVTLEYQHAETDNAPAKTNSNLVLLGIRVAF